MKQTSWSRSLWYSLRISLRISLRSMPGLFVYGIHATHPSIYLSNARIPDQRVATDLQTGSLFTGVSASLVTDQEFANYGFVVLKSLDEFVARVVPAKIHLLLDGKDVWGAYSSTRLRAQALQAGMFSWGAPNEYTGLTVEVDRTLRKAEIDIVSEPKTM